MVVRSVRTPPQGSPASFSLRPGATSHARLVPVLAAVALLTAACASSRSGAVLSPNPPPAFVVSHAPLVDILHYDVDVDIDHVAGEVKGQVAIQFQALPDHPVSELELDAVELQIADAWDAEGHALKHSLHDDKLVVQLAQPLPPGSVQEVTLHYSCFPRRGMYFEGPTADDTRRPWHVWTQGETHETRHWLPCWDQPNDRATITLHATVDKSFRTMSSGKLTESRVNEATGRRTDTWVLDVPCVSYLFTLVAGQLGQAEIPGGPVPLLVVADEDKLADAVKNFAATPDFVEFFADYTGQPYPYPKYSQSCVHDFVAGGQENISATTLLVETIHSPSDEPQASSLDLISHECAHQWFGDFLTCADWSHLWLNESFATICEALYRGHVGGEDAYRLCVLAMRSKALAATDELERPIVWSGYKDPEDTFGKNAYEGGAIRLNLLRDLLGASALQRGIAHYVQQHAAGIVVTDDLRRSLEESTGADLARFFDEFLLGPGVPEFRVRLSADERTLAVEQTQGTRGWRPVFHLPVWVTWSRGGKESSARLDVDAASMSLSLDGDGALDWYRFDSHTAVPGRIDQEQSEEQWRAQLRKADDGVSRLLAARWFLGNRDVRADVPTGWRPQPQSVAALVAAAGKDALVEVRVAALAALAQRGATDDPVIAQALLDAAHATDARVREIAAAGLAHHGDTASLPVLVSLVDDPNASVAAAALGALVDLDHPGALALCTGLAERTTKGKLDEAIVRLVSRIDNDEAVLPFELIAARREPMPAVRVAAVEALADLADRDGIPGAGDPDGVIFRQLGESLNDASYRVRAAAASALRQIAQATSSAESEEPEHVPATATPPHTGPSHPGDAARPAGGHAPLAPEMRAAIATRARAAEALLAARRTIEMSADVLTAIDSSAAP
jgi:aminopeptidase N